MHYTYILECADGTYYTGYTNHLEQRIKAHNSGKGAKYTKGRTPVKLVYYESFEEKSRALSREHEIKRLSKRQKAQLIENEKAAEKGTLPDYSDEKI